MNYYNEFDPKAAAWLRELIKGKLIPNGVVDERSIEDVKPDDLRGFTQCHFFAGIGGWSYALKLAGWPEDRQVWTGSCPCQPFSTAGKGAGTSDERHLWPAFHWLIRECKPQTVFGEQVASKAGAAWLDVVSADLEAEGYAIGPIVLPACGVGAPHIRQRTWFVADNLSNRSQGRIWGGENEKREVINRPAGCGGTVSDLADLQSAERNGQRAIQNWEQGGSSNSSILGHAEIIDGRLSNKWRIQNPESEWTSKTNWDDADWIFCKDNKYRPVESGTFPLAYGVSGRVGLLRGYGNAIVPQVAKEVIEAFMDLTP